MRRYPRAPVKRPVPPVMGRKVTEFRAGVDEVIGYTADPPTVIWLARSGSANANCTVRVSLPWTGSSMTAVVPTPIIVPVGWRVPGR